MVGEGRAFEVFFDGDCPLCVREIRLLRFLDRKRKRIVFTDIASTDFSAVEATGLTHDALMAEIYGRTADGVLVSGVDVFRQLYGAVGFGWLLAPTRWPGLRQMSDTAYALFAKNRLRMTGRCGSDGVCEVAAGSVR